MFSYYDFWVLFIGKAIKGTSIGLLSGVIPIYINEVFDKRFSRKVLSVFQSVIPLGLFFSSLASYVGALGPHAIFPKNLVATWLLTFIPISAAIFLCPFIRDSPRDFFAFGNAAIALELVELHSDPKGMNEREFRNYVQERAVEMMAPSKSLMNEQESFSNGHSFEGKKKTRLAFSKFSGCFKSTEVLTAIFTQCSVQLSGINAFMYYFSEICTMSNMESKTTSILSLCLFAANFAVNLIGSIYAAKVSRVMNMFYGFLVMGLCHMLLFLALQSKKTGVSSEASQADASGVLAIAYCFIAVITFALTIAIPSMLYTTEIIPLTLSEIGIPLSVACGWFLNFTLTLVLPMLFKIMSAYVFTFFGAFCIILYAVFLNLEDTYAQNELKIIDFDVDSFSEKPVYGDTYSGGLETDRSFDSSTKRNTNRSTTNGPLLSVRGTIRGGLTRSWTRSSSTFKKSDKIIRPNKLSVIGTIRGSRLSKEWMDSTRNSTKLEHFEGKLDSIPGSDESGRVESNESECGVTQHTGYYEENLANLKLDILSPFEENCSKPTLRKLSYNMTDPELEHECTGVLNRQYTNVGLDPYSLK